MLAEEPLVPESSSKNIITTGFSQNLVVISFKIYPKTRKRYSFAAIN
jgi:hypothetical protein